MPDYLDDDLNVYVAVVVGCSGSPFYAHQL
jgi:hypothetical protein